MAGYLSTYLANKLLDAELGGTAYTAPGTVYIRAWTTLPAADGTGGVEVSGGSYAAVTVTNNATNFPAASGGAKTNGIAFTFAAPTANWGTIAGLTIHDAATGGNMLRAGPLSVPFPVNNGDPALSIAAGAANFGYEASA